MYNISVPVKGNKLRNWKRDFSDKSAGGCSAYGVIAPWPDLSRSNFFCQKLRKRCPVSYAKVPPSASAVIKKVIGVAFPPPPVPAGVNMHQFSHSVRLSNYEITCEWLFRLCSSMWRALDSWAKRRVTPGWSCFSDRSLLLNGMVCGQLVQFCVSTFYSIRMLYDHSCNSTEC